MKRLLLASTSTVYGSEYLEYLLPTLKSFFKSVDKILFIPFARPRGISFNDYTETVAIAFENIDIKVSGIHKFENAAQAIEESEAIFVGGGNTFVLVNELYQQNLMGILKQKINSGTPYLGTSAGSNIAGISMQTTNDMPIVYPPTHTTLGCIPFNINAHYLDADPLSKHKGETRETRINEFHTYNETPVLGLREGSWLEVNGDDIVLKGELTARWFQKGKSCNELRPEDKVDVKFR